MIDIINNIFGNNGMIFPYSEYASLAIGIGMVISLFLTETLGVMAGGIIVPGYFALYLQNPIQVIITFIISLITYLVIFILSKFLLIYGRRRLILCLLVGFFLGYIFRIFMSELSIHLNYIGFIIPGLVASWMDRQGITRTVSVIVQ